MRQPPYKCGCFYGRKQHINQYVNAFDIPFWLFLQGTLFGGAYGKDTLM